MKGLFLGIFFALASFAAAQNPPCQGGLGGTVFATGDDIQVEVIQGEGSYERSVQLYLSASGQEWVYCGNSDIYGEINTVSNLVGGDELIFFIYAYPTGDVFTIGPTNRNPDGVAHAKVYCETNGSTLIGFEDSYGGGDYADIVFRVTRIPTRPGIVTQPASQRVDVGMNATLSVAASGSGPLFYQWFKGGAVIVGATNSLLSLTNFQEAGQGVYTVSVSNALGQVSSSSAQLAINRGPVAAAAVFRRVAVSPNGISAVVRVDGSGSSDADNDALRYAWFEAGATNAFAATKVALITKPLGWYSFTLVVSDDRLSSSLAVVVRVVTISEALQNLVNRVNQVVTGPGTLRAELRGKLPAAIALYRRGNVGALKNELQAFQSRVGALVQPIDAELAAELMQLAQDILDALNAPTTQLMASASSPFQIDLAWTDASANEEGFKIERSTDGVNFTQIAQVLPNTTRYRDAGVFPDTTRFYRVRSFRGKSNGAYSNVGSAATPGSACALSIAKLGSSTWPGTVMDPPEGLRQVVSVAIGEVHALGLKSDGTVIGWGNDFLGQITPPPGLSNVVAVAAGDFHSVALKSDGTVVTWGTEYLWETMPTNLSGVVAIAAARYHSLALRNDGTVVAWGVGYTPVPAGLKGVVAIATSETHSLALKSDGTVVAWGDSYSGQSTVPAGLRGVVAIAAGSYRNLALKNDGTIVGWESGAFGQPTNVVYATAIAAIDRTTFAVLPNGTVRQWGDGIAQPEGLKNVQAIFASRKFAYALTALPWAPGIKGLKITAQSQVQLSWTNNDAGTDGFVIERASQFNGITGNWSVVGTAGPSTTQFTDLGASPGSAYYYRVQSQNACGKSLYKSSQWISFTPPNAPESLRAQIGEGNVPRVDVFWSDTLDNAAGFVLERAPDSGGVPGVWSEIASIGATNNLFHQYGFADTNVTGFTTNWYRVRAFNPLGDSSYSASAQIELVPPTTAPDASVRVFQDQVVINLYSYVEGATGFQIERAPDVSGSPGTWSLIGTRTNRYDADYIDAGLAPGTYWYRVRAFNWVGVSPGSSPKSATITAPEAPQIQAWVGMTNQVGMEIRGAPPFDQDGFTIERAGDVGGSPGTWAEIGTAPATNYANTYFTDTNALAKTTNWYRARAFNKLGHSDYSDPFEVELVAPPPPDQFGTRSVRDQLTVNWNATYPGHLDGFQIDRARDVNGSPGTWSRIAAITNRFESHEGSYDDSGLSAGTYWYRFRAYNWLGMSTNSAPVAATIAVPNAPVVTAQMGLSKRVEVDFFGGYSPDQDGFKLERAADKSGGPGAWKEIATIRATNISHAFFADTNVKANTTNWYRARAFNPVGLSAYSEPVEVALVPPPPPDNLYMEALGASAILYWNEPFSGPVGGYQIDRAPDLSGSPGAWKMIATVTNAEHGGAFTNAGLTLGTYWYRMRAYNWVGMSSNSSAASVTIVQPDAPWLSALVGPSNQVDVTVFATYPFGQDGFKLERAGDEQGGPGAWTEIASIAATNLDAGHYADTNVMANTTNWYRARAFNALGFSPYSEAMQFEVVPPPAPTYLNASAYRDEVALNYYEDYAGQVDGFHVERAPDVSGSPGSWSLVAVASSPYDWFDSGLSLGSYWYRVRAFNWIGASSNTTPVRVTIGPPGIPLLDATVGTKNHADISISGGEPQDQDGFRLERAADVAGSPGGWTEIAVLEAKDYADAYYTETNLIANTTNWYRARAFNELGVSDYSTPLRLEVVPPLALSYFTANVFRDRVSLGWVENYHGTFEGYQIDRAPDVSGTPGIWATIATNSAGESYYQDVGLALGSYWYRVRAFNWVGISADYNPLKVTIAPPRPPSTVSVALGITNRVNVEMRGDAPYDQEGFKIERASDEQGNPGEWTEIGAKVAPSYYPSVFTDTNAQPYTTNWYRVRAYNSLGNSGYSAPASVAIVPPGVPPNFTATPYYGSTINLRWGLPSGFVQRYQVERAPNTNGAAGAWERIVDWDVGLSYQSQFNNLPVSWLDNPPVAGGAYWYRVRAGNWVGTSAFSPEVGINIPPNKLGGVALPVGPLRITSIAVSNGGVQLNWETTGGTTNFVEAAATLDGPFSIISPAIVIPGEGVTRTNFEDSGKVLENSQRYYRILSR